MATAYIINSPPAYIEKPNDRKKTYLRRCTICKGEFYFCGDGCNYNYCPICGRPFAGRVKDGNET